MRAYAVRLLRLRRIEFSVHTGLIKPSYFALALVHEGRKLLELLRADAVSEEPARLRRRLFCQGSNKTIPSPA